ncbi:MAG TPA: 8-amino-7-oxononanoate synthase [Hyphomicrobium sp.]|nr:8-amino-7-oxononanoate synthase [Hyphomicrobium sp.]
MSDSHERALKALERRGRLRALSPRSGIDFSSNDYLGLAASGELSKAVAVALERGVAIGAGGSRLLRGNDPEHEALEAEAQAFFGAESCLYFGGGFVANYALFSTLPARGDLVVHDALIHASVIDGMRAGKATIAAADHNDAQSFDDAITHWRAEGGTGRPWIAVETLYSMDGDQAPLSDLIAVARRHDGFLVVDEAHATGVLGPGGRGLAHALEGAPDVISLHTCGKALGASGALVLTPQVIRDFLINRARPFIYATAPSPLMAAAVRAALRLVREDNNRRQRLADLVAFTGRELQHRCGLTPSASHIQPVILGTDERAVSVAKALVAEGFDVRAVRPPTVPENTARLRVSLTLNAGEDATARLLDTLAAILERVPA